MDAVEESEGTVSGANCWPRKGQENAIKIKLKVPKLKEQKKSTKSGMKIKGKSD